MTSTVVIAAFRSPAEAELARRAVESAGIAVSLAGTEAVTRLSVPAGDAERALQIVGGLWPEPPSEIRAALAEPERCPECGWHEFIRIRRLPFLAAFSVVMYGVGVAVRQTDLFILVIAIVAALLFLGPNRRCTACGERWRSWQAPPRPPEEPPIEPPDVPCPRCGGIETAPIDRRRLKGWTLLVNFLLPPLLLIWPFLPRRRCEDCGWEWR